MILLIDNYDSFSYNLVQLIGGILKEENMKDNIKVIRNDELSIEEIKSLKPSHLILSPGPGRPADAGVCEALIPEMMDTTPILGVCLGHQAICETFGAKITYAATLMHGKKSIINIKEDSIFAGLPRQIPVARYHSLAADKDSMPDCLDVLATADDGEIMAVKHKEHLIYGFQFHPESVLTPDGKTMITNFLNN